MKTTGNRIKHGQISESDPNLRFWAYCGDREYWVSLEKYDELTNKALENKKKRYWSNRELYLEKHKNYRLKNKDRVLELSRQYDKKRANCPKRRNWVRSWTKTKRATDHSFDTSIKLRVRLANALKKKNTYKSASTEELLGCRWDQFLNWIESKFADGMSWNNRNLWHIDHIRPCCSFDLSDPDQQKQCFHYTNLQPLWAEDNLRKNGRY